MDELDRLYRRVVQNIRAAFPELLTRAFEVSQLYQQIVPYRTNRRELELDSNEEYELALMQLLAGLRGYLSGDAELQKAMRSELASPNPDLAAFRVFATSAVALAPDALRAWERRGLMGDSSPAQSSSLSPNQQAALAGRATEAVEVTDDVPLVPGASRPTSSTPDAPRASSPAPSASAPAPAAAPAPSSPPRTAASALAPAAPAAPAAPVRSSTPSSSLLTGRAPLGRREAPAASLEAPMSAPRITPPVSAPGETCRYCSGALPDGRRITFCPSCGHNLTVQHCPACATELEVGWKFCITCGREVGSPDEKRATGGGS